MVYSTVTTNTCHHHYHLRHLIMLPQMYIATTFYSYAVLCSGPLSTAWKQGELFLSKISNDQSMNNFDWSSWKSIETEFGFILFFPGKQWFAGIERENIVVLESIHLQGFGQLQFLFCNLNSLWILFIQEMSASKKKMLKLKKEWNLKTAITNCLLKGLSFMCVHYGSVCLKRFMYIFSYDKKYTYLYTCS